MGWVSLFDPVALGHLLGMPAGAQAVAVLCLGHVTGFYREPMLQQQHWAERRPLDELVFDNQWPKDTT